MLGQYMRVDSVLYPNPTDYNKNPTDHEEVNLSEAYTELTAINRLQKFAADFTFQVSSRWAEKIETDCRKPEVTLVLDGKEYIGRLRFKGSKLKKGSEYVRGTNGLWTVKVKFTER